ncbi:MAG: hypothetical protein J6W77_00090 [Prevotella sp.]|nr:hypothetical protein [Prevotella sp.]
MSDNYHFFRPPFSDNNSYVLASLIHSADGYMNRYTLKVIPGSFVMMLEDGYQGFVIRADGKKLP